MCTGYWQVSNIHAGTGANNVIPASLEVDFNFRFCTKSTVQSLKRRLEDILRRYGLDFSIEWNLSGIPFVTRSGELVEAVKRSILAHTGLATELSTSGGTSDGRFIAQICPQIIELGPVNASIHKLNENIELAALERLPSIYLDVLRALLP